jgi:MoxR-like ATPase
MNASLTPTHTLSRLTANIETVIQGQREAIVLALIALASGGHVLLEDYPGTGKTTLAKALAKSIGIKFRRIQFTPDLLPSDILGVSVFDQVAQRFDFHEGPIFTQILLADEINRASPRTQSALLEAMAESQVSVEGRTHRFDEPFFVIATQNPVEFRGTYPLPEAQMDRFAIRFSLGYVEAAQEVAILDAQRQAHPLDALQACATLDEVLALRRAVTEVRITDELKRYIVDLVRASRAAPGVAMGASPRASLALMKAAQARALCEGRAFVIPDDVRVLAAPVMAHRLVLEAEARYAGVMAETIVAELLQSLVAPA